MPVNERNIYEKGKLITLHAGVFKGVKKMNEDQMRGLPTEIVRGFYDIFDADFKKLIKDIESFDCIARNTLKKMSAPFPVDGFYFVMSANLEKVMDFLEERKTARRELIQVAVDNYEDAINSFAEKYPEYYQLARHRYISKNAFKDRFYFEYQLLKLAPPDENDPLITPEMYRKEQSKFKQNIEDMKTEVLTLIKSNLLEATARLTKQCTDGRPNQGTLDNLNRFLSRIDETFSDFIDRKDVKEMIKKVRATALGVDADALRDNDDFKTEFGTQMKKLAENIKVLPDIPLRRAIDF